MPGEQVREAYRAHSGELFGFACRSLGDRDRAEEAVQECFLKAWRARDKFDPEIGSERTWLYAILRNVIADMGRTDSRRPSGIPLDDSGDSLPSVEQPFERAMLAWQVEEALRRIGERHRQIVVETCLRGRPYAEVAAALGVPEGTIKSRVYYGLRAMRDAMEELGYES
ncbi:MAG: sigma-70 family RNA polymerase sigma factor [Thermoleophilales bacterium]|nr:sigma-70 family RNA polymerase sigma factor [Thermoleophilales bacterium]